MKVLLVTPPHTNPVGPTLGIAVLSAHIKKQFPEVNVEAMDMGLDAMYWLLSDQTIKNAVTRLEKTINRLNAEKRLNYEQQRQYLKCSGALCVLRAIGKDVPRAISQLKDKETYYNDQIRVNANFIINKVLESIGVAWPETQLNAGDYRTELSPFSINDIKEYVTNAENSIYNDFFEQWLSEHDLFDVKLLGISISFAKQMLPSLLFASKVRKLYPNLLIEIGGSMMAHLNREALIPLFQWCDCIVQREGEYPLEHLVCAIREGKPFSPKMGVLYLDEEGNLIIGDKMPKVHLEQELVPDFSHFRLKDYMVPSPNIPLQIGRSCYWGKCTFCCLNTAFEHKNCWTNVEKLVDDIENLIASQEIETIEFVDDAIPPIIARSLSAELLHRQCKVKWFCYARFDDGFDLELFEQMHQSGCVGLKFGLESASPRVSQMMNKGIDIQKAAKLFENAYQAGIIPQAAFFLGFPGEREEDIWKTVNFIENHVVDYGIVAYNGIFRLLRSMPLLVEPEKYGIKNISKWNMKEELIDYYQVEMMDFFDIEKYALQAEQYLATIIYKDLTRSVDLRRYWFAGYGKYGLKENITEKYSQQLQFESHFPLDEIVIMQDKNKGDFLPGKGVYSEKSYISDGLHAESIINAMNKMRKSLAACEPQTYIYQVEEKKFKRG